jgi:hypothetical protein
VLRDSGISGQPSRFNERFKAGAPISAQDLNALAAGITATTPQFYLGEGPQISLGSGGVQIVDNRDIGISKPTPWKPRDNGDGSFWMYPGTVNSLIPCIGDPGIENLLTFKGTPKPYETYSFNSAGDCYIYLQCAIGSGTPPQWPEVDPTNVNYPTIYAFDSPQTDDDTYGFILLALAQKDPASTATNPPVTFTQFVFNSLWTERHKYSQPNSALYYFYRV